MNFLLEVLLHFFCRMFGLLTESFRFVDIFGTGHPGLTLGQHLQFAVQFFHTLIGRYLDGIVLEQNVQGGRAAVVKLGVSLFNDLQCPHFGAKTAKQAFGKNDRHGIVVVGLETQVDFVTVGANRGLGGKIKACLWMDGKVHENFAVHEENQYIIDFAANQSTSPITHGRDGRRGAPRILSCTVFAFGQEDTTTIVTSKDQTSLYDGQQDNAVAFGNQLGHGHFAAPMRGMQGGFQDMIGVPNHAFHGDTVRALDGRLGHSRLVDWI
mmetsp:Transcript_17766/g.33472  ORF Transcript_17766/g.33472 Transcript_17766/m.33472 type:complete len:267 (-) Transcript_17766:154-954(-)